jgi:hypothetical protein
MNMDLNRDDLAALCAGMTTEEVDRVHRLLHEWGVGPEDSFPVQLALLTRAQWSTAATLIRSMNDSRKWMEAHFGQYQQQTKTMLDDCSRTVQTGARELETIVATHAKSTEQAIGQIQAKFNAAEAVAGRIQGLMEKAATEWEAIKAAVTVQCERLEQVSDDLEDRFVWRIILRTAAWLLLALALGILIGHYWIR